MPFTIDQEAFYKVPEIASLIGLSEQQIRRLIRDKRIHPATKAGKTFFVRGYAIIEYLTGKPVIEQQAPENIDTGKRLPSSRKISKINDMNTKQRGENGC